MVYCRVESVFPPFYRQVSSWETEEKVVGQSLCPSPPRTPLHSPSCLFFFLPKGEEEALRDGGDYVLLIHF